MDTFIAIVTIFAISFLIGFHDMNSKGCMGFVGSINIPYAIGCKVANDQIINKGK